MDDERGGAAPRPPEPDVIVIGGSPDDRPPSGGSLRWRGLLRWHGPLRWLAIPVALGAVAALVVLAQAGRQAGPEARRSALPPPSSAPAASLSAPATSSPPSFDVTVTNVGRPLLGLTAGWELFGWGPGGVVRIELARGRVTRTGLPSLSSNGPMSFLVGRDWAMGRLVLVDDGKRAGGSIAIPVTLGGYVQTDSAGYVLLQGPGGVYDARPDGLRRVTTGHGARRRAQPLADVRVRRALPVQDDRHRPRYRRAPHHPPGGDPELWLHGRDLA